MSDFKIGADVNVAAQIVTRTGDWSGSRQVPSFIVPGFLGARDWDGVAKQAMSILAPFGPEALAGAGAVAVHFSLLQKPASVWHEVTVEIRADMCPRCGMHAG